jgi:hypothetical protein
MYKIIDDKVVQHIESTTFFSIEPGERGSHSDAFDEWLADGNVPDPPEIRPWEAPPSKAERLQESEPEAVEALEDIVDLLVSKGILTEEELPAKVKNVLNNRKAIREE